MSELGQRLKRLRRERLLTQQDLAVKAGLAVVTVARLETKPPPDRLGRVNYSTLRKLAKALDVPVTALIDDETDATEPAETAT